MRRMLIALPALLLAAMLLTAAKPPVTVKLDAAAKKQPAVTFTHDKHVKAAKTCDSCHHTQKGLTAEKDTKVEKCSACHLDPKDPKVPGMRDMSLTKNVFHVRCIACHKEQKKGPTTCVKCHVKA
jgi:Class III cytochrome C family